jgi:selenocysteine lyase/cysteine desulfurase
MAGEQDIVKQIRGAGDLTALETLRVLGECGATVYGVQGQARVAERVPTICFNLPGVLPQRVTEVCARAGIGIRDGHMYAPRLMDRLGVSRDTGVVRVSLVHYNTAAEIARFGTALREVLDDLD